MERGCARGIAAVVVLVVSAGGGSAWAQANELRASAEKLLAQGDTSTAMPMLLQAANHGDVRAKYDLGVAYEGIWAKVGGDREQILEWYEEAAMGGETAAMVKLGQMYSSGAIDLVIDLKTAGEWYARAAAMGNVDGVMGEAFLARVSNEPGGMARAQALLEDLAAKRTAFRPEKTPLTEAQLQWLRGMLSGIAKEYEKDEVTSERAIPVEMLVAELGDASGAITLAKRYLVGDGVTRSPANAARLLRAVSDPSKLDAGVDRMNYWTVLRFAAVDYMKGMSAENAAKLKDALAAEKDISAAIKMASRYARGDGVPLSVAQAERKVAAVDAVGEPSSFGFDDSDAYYAVEKLLGDDYLHGRSVTPNAKTALELYESAADGGNNGASVEAGLMYVQGKVVQFDEDKAVEYLALEPMARVVVPTAPGMPGSQVAEAVKELSPLEKSHFALATRLLAERYERGDGVEKASWKVRQWYVAAALAGDSIAKAKVSKMPISPAKVMEPKPVIRPGRPGRGPAIAGASQNTGTVKTGGFGDPTGVKPAPVVMPPPPPAAETSAQVQAMINAMNAQSQSVKKSDPSVMDAIIRGNAGSGEQADVLNFPEETVSGELAKPGASSGASQLEPPKIAPPKAVSPPPAPSHSVLPTLDSLGPTNGGSHTTAENASVEERYPNIEAPDVVHPAQEFAVLVSLTGEQISPETRIVSGRQNEGKLEIPIPAGMTSIELEVNLTAPGMEFVDGSNMATIELDKGQDSTVAQFHLRVRAGTPAGQPKLMATFWYNHGFVARVERSVEIAAGGSPDAATKPAALMKTAPAPVTMAAKPSEPSGRAPGIQLDVEQAAPDLTIVESRSGDALHVTFISRYSSPVEDTLPKEAEMRAYLHAKYAAMAQHGRGTQVEPSTTSVQASEDFARGFGNELWDRFAPAGLKKLYWQLHDAGVQVRTIQVLSDDPVLPWELMRPAREGGGTRGNDRQDFLALTTRVARWQMGESAMARPPQMLEVKRMVVVAPRYTGAMALSGAQAEAAALHSAAGFEEVRGDYKDFRALAANLPDGIVHFAGHGMVKEADGGAQFAILLEDGEVVPATWKELSSASTTHPFYFFNACEVGQAQQAVSALDGWGPALLESGASGYLGALWPVSDKAAGTFAGNFYKWMAATPGLPVAELVRLTRQQTYEETHDLTALSYVLYADPYLQVKR